MKKLSLVLALIFVLTCALVACGGDETSSSSEPATSSAAASSEAASSEAASSEEASSEDPVSSEEPTAPVEITGSNIAGNATYVTSALYQQGGADVEWNWDENAPISYPDEDGNTMVDGLTATALDFTDSAWIGFHGKTPGYAETGYHTITFDLGAATAITGVKVAVGTADLGGGITAPSSVELCVSEDGETYTSVTTATPANVAMDAFATEIVELPAGVTAQYVQVRVVSGEAWAFVSEVEIYSDAE